MDMSVMNPYVCNFGKVIPKGMTFGLNGALGKWFTPEYGLRGRVQWENGLIPNNSVEWVPPVEDPKQNYKKGGLATIAIDAMLNLTNVVAGYAPERKWHTTGYVRAGIITQFVEGSGSPLMGVGLEEMYRLNDKWSLFGDAELSWYLSDKLLGSGSKVALTTTGNTFNETWGQVPVS